MGSKSILLLNGKHQVASFSVFGYIKLSCNYSWAISVDPLPFPFLIILTCFAWKQDGTVVPEWQEKKRTGEKQERETGLLMKPSGCSQHHRLALAQKLCFLFCLSLQHGMPFLCSHDLFIVPFINNLIEKHGGSVTWKFLDQTGPIESCKHGLCFL